MLTSFFADNETHRHRHANLLLRGRRDGQTSARASSGTRPPPSLRRMSRAAGQRVVGDMPTSFSVDDEHASREVEGRWRPWPVDGKVLDGGWRWRSLRLVSGCAAAASTEKGSASGSSGTWAGVGCVATVL
jgi:hypothetical protein